MERRSELFPCINEEIIKIRREPEYQNRIRRLERLYDQERDGMVAYEIGCQHRSRHAFKHAAVWFSKAEVDFPKDEFRAIARAARELAEQEASRSGSNCITPPLSEYGPQP